MGTIWPSYEPGDIVFIPHVVYHPQLGFERGYYEAEVISHTWTAVNVRMPDGAITAVDPALVNHRY